MNVLLGILAALPLLGTQLRPLPEGKGKAQVVASCLPCHSSDILLQQRLTEKQWTASVEKMIDWGAKVKPEDKAVMIGYLSRRFGPANRFNPVKTRPAK